MKKFNYLVTGVMMTSLVFGGLIACGGGSSSSNKTADAVALTADSVARLAVNMADALPGCSYVSDEGMTDASPKAVAAYRTGSAQILKQFANVNKIPMAAVRATTINETIAGMCASAPGELIMTGSHESGVDDIDFTFANFCLGDDEGSVTINGVAYVENVGEPSDFGPIPQYVAISTGATGILLEESTSEGDFTHSFTVDDLVYTFGNGDDIPTATMPDTISLDALSIVDGRSQETFAVSNVDLAMYEEESGETENMVINIKKLTYTDPENGAVVISSPEAIVLDSDDVIVSGTIQIAGEGDTVLLLTPSTLLENSFDMTLQQADAEPEMVGMMDCSALSVDVDLDAL